MSSSLLPRKLILSRQVAQMKQIDPLLGDFGRQVVNTLNDLNDSLAARLATSQGITVASSAAVAELSPPTPGPTPAVVFQQTVTLGADVTLAAATLTNILSIAVTMPSGSGAFRAIVYYGICLSGSGATVDAIVTDGTNPFASSQTGLPSTDVTGQNADGPSPVTYPPGENITFTLQVKSNGVPVVKASALEVGQGTWLSVLILTN